MYYIGGMQCDPDYLKHFGIKGQRWGIRRYQNEDGSLTPEGQERYYKEIDRTAKKDAEEYARAKMFYGEGAGTRRKLINKTVEERSKDPEYKARFEKYFSEQNMAEHAQAAQRERKFQDTKNGVAKTARSIRNVITGNWQYAGTAVLAAFGAWSVLHATGKDQAIIDWGRNIVNSITGR